VTYILSKSLLTCGMARIQTGAGVPVDVQAGKESAIHALGVNV